mgnify:CR=1 FL=1
MLQPTILIYTDGSCHTQQLIGAWAAIIFIEEEKFILSGTEENTTNNRMELTAIIKALKFTEQHNLPESAITIITDSQYAVGLPDREQKFITSNFKTKNGNPISNEDLVKTLLQLLKRNIVKLEKIRAHLKQTDEPNYNIEADKLSRNLVRQAIKTND